MTPAQGRRVIAAILIGVTVWLAVSYVQAQAQVNQCERTISSISGGAVNMNSYCEARYGFHP